jgi:hypothetical protein
MRKLTRLNVEGEEAVAERCIGSEDAEAVEAIVRI